MIEFNIEKLPKLNLTPTNKGYKKMLIEVKNRWEEFRTLDGLKDNEKQELAMIFETLAQFILKDGLALNKIFVSSSLVDAFDIVSFPMLRRLFHEKKISYNFNNHSDSEVSILKFCSTLNRELSAFYNNKNEYLKKHNIETNQKSDLELDFCVLFSDKYPF